MPGVVGVARLATGVGLTRLATAPLGVGGAFAPLLKTLDYFHHVVILTSCVHPAINYPIRQALSWQGLLRWFSLQLNKESLIARG